MSPWEGNSTLEWRTSDIPELFQSVGSPGSGQGFGHVSYIASSVPGLGLPHRHDSPSQTQG
jgi:hypothetical protein